MSLKSDIENASPGARIRLPDDVVLNETITVPVGVSLIGGHVVAEFETLSHAFIVSSGVTFKDVSLKLGAYAKGVYGTGVADVKMLGLHVEGSEAEFGNGGKAIDLAGSNLHVEACHVENTYGGIYVDGADLRVIRNHLKRVNFGNVCAVGARVWILDNAIDEPGIPNAYHHASGDGITFGGCSYVAVARNSVRVGHCYGIGAFSAVENAVVADNTVEDGATSGIYLVNPVGVLLSGNQLRQNAAHGIALINPSYVAATGNHFYGDTLFVDGGSNGQYTPNTYVLSEGLIQ